MFNAGAPNRDAALDFMMHASSPQSQAEQAKYITYGPMRASGIPIIQNNEPWGPHRCRYYASYA